MSANIARSLISRCYSRFQVQQQRFQSYKAALLKETDEALQIEAIKEVKKLEKNQVRVKVHYCSLNSNDVTHFKDNKTKNYIPGYELSGEVLEVGSDVKPGIASVGQRVAALSRDRGGFAEQCVVNAGDVWNLPSNIKTKDAAVIIFGHTNALYAFSCLTKITEDSKILITAGPAGLGLAAIDIAANVFKAKPFGICGSEEMSALVRERGAFKTATFKTKNLTKLCGNADVIYDAVGEDSHKYVNACIKPEGSIFYAGPSSITIPSPPLNSWLSVVNIEGLRTSNFELYRSLVSEVLEMADEEIISAYISAEYELEDIADAVKYIEDKKCTGKVLIRVLDD